MNAAPGPAAGADPPPLRLCRHVPGRALLVQPDGTLFIGRRHRILASGDDGRTWRPVASLPHSWRSRLGHGSRLAARLLRQEVRALARLADGTLVASSREGVFRGAPGEGALTPSAFDASEPRVRAPLRLEAGPRDQIVWGEYGPARAASPVRLFASRDGGASFRAVHRFAPGEVGHVHNVVYDAHLDQFWVLAGDHGSAAGIGVLSSDLERFEWFVRGEQRFRAVALFDLGDRLLYATDTEVEENALVSLDKRTGKAECLRRFEGSCLHACRFGGFYALSTTVEPSRINRSRDATLWISRDGSSWHCVLRARKDRWNADAFQFGSLVLPAGASDRDVLLLSGQAVRRLDGTCAVAHLAGERHP